MTALQLILLTAFSIASFFLLESIQMSIHVHKLQITVGSNVHFMVGYSFLHAFPYAFHFTVFQLLKVISLIYNNETLSIYSYHT